MTDLATRLGKTIKSIRARQDLTQSQLAERADLSVSYVSLIEQGKRVPGVDVLEKIARAMGVPFNILVFLASDKSELEGIDQEAAEKLSLLAMKLLEAKDDQAQVST